MLHHERQARHAKLQNAIDLADEHAEAVQTAKNLQQQFDTLLFSVGSARTEGSTIFRGQACKLCADLAAAFGPRFAELAATAQHDLNNAEQTVVILRSGIAA